MIRILILPLMCVLIVLISACSNSTYKSENTADLCVGVADVTMEIRGGILYVTPYKGPTYRTSVKADDISVLRPEIGTGKGGSMCSATVLKDGATVATFDRSYVDSSKITKSDLEIHFGHVTRVLSPFEMIVVISVSIFLCVIAIGTGSSFIGKRKKKINSNINAVSANCTESDYISKTNEGERK